MVGNLTVIEFFAYGLIGTAIGLIGVAIFATIQEWRSN